METFLLVFPVLLFSVIVHECAHGYVAEWWGDPTARMLGRLTLNPIPHIDLVGSIIVPAVMILLPGGVIFGWAKPVPVTPDNYRDRKLGDITVSLAGPASNVLLAFGFAAILAGFAIGGRVPWVVGAVCQYAIIINFILAVFNLIPIPPLDGSHVVANLLPPRAAYAYRSMGQAGLLVLLVLLFVLPGVLSIVFLPAELAARALIGFVAGIR